MCIYMYRYLSDETKIKLLQNYIRIKELYDELTKYLAETIRNMDEDTVRENTELILKIMSSYTEASRYMDEMNELIIVTFLDPSLLSYIEKNSL